MTSKRKSGNLSVVLFLLLPLLLVTSVSFLIFTSDHISCLSWVGYKMRNGVTA